MLIQVVIHSYNSLLLLRGSHIQQYTYGQLKDETIICWIYHVVCDYGCMWFDFYKYGILVVYVACN